MAAADGRFSRIRQVAPMCPPMRAHWCHLANTIELVLPSVHPSPQPEWQIDRFSRFCTAHGRESLYLIMGNPFPKIAPSHSVTVRPTDHATRSVTIDGIYVYMYVVRAMRFNNIRVSYSLAIIRDFKGCEAVLYPAKSQFILYS